MKIFYTLFLYIFSILLLKGSANGEVANESPHISVQRRQAHRLLHVPLRVSPTILSQEDAQEMIHRHGFYERLIHPENDLPNQYLQMTSQSDVVVTDLRHNLMWAVGIQLRASSENAPEVLANLQYAGYNDWRLPTLEELVSLLEPQQQTTHYYSPAFENFHFDTTLSSDNTGEGVKTFVWSVNFTEGIITTVSPNTFWCLLPVRELSKPPIRTEGGTTIRGIEHKQ